MPVEPRRATAKTLGAILALSFSCSSPGSSGGPSTGSAGGSGNAGNGFGGTVASSGGTMGSSGTGAGGGGGRGSGGATTTGGTTGGAGSTATGGTTGSGGMTMTGGTTGSGGKGDGGAGATTGAGGMTATGSGGVGARGGGGGEGGTGATGRGGASGNGGVSGVAGATPGKIKYVFVIAMENQDANSIVGNTQDAKYINDTLIASYASASNFNDELSIGVVSEPHYVWMEAGTNQFSDRTFSSDDDPSAANSTADTNHLVTQIKNAANGLTWLSFQQGLSNATGACPIASSGYYAAKHDPFVFFKDVAGNPPSKTNADCAAHHRPLSSPGDVTSGTVATYNFLTPDLCHDMHGATGCADSNKIRSGDAWLEANLPPLIQFVNTNAGVIFIVWDEGEGTTKIPFIAVGPGVKTNYVGAVSYTHSSLLKSTEEILGLPVSSRVASANDFSDLFKPGYFP